MRQLLTWCGARALPEKAHGGSGDANEMLAVDAARHIQEELLKDFANKSEMSDWFNREDTAPTAIVKKPNPRNIQNATKLQQLEDEIKRLQDEKRSWETLLKSPSPIAESSSANPQASATTIDSTCLDPSQAAILATLQSSAADTNSTNSSADPISTRLQALASSLEPKIDLFADGVHKLSQYRMAAERVADKILESTAKRLDSRDLEAREAIGTKGVGARDVLSALGSALGDPGR